jgi:protein-S-isoprenylcysteine O-methyltransferase Ste14
MARPLVPILNTILFTILVPGTVIVYIPYRLTGGFARPMSGPGMWLGAVVVTIGEAVYFRCAWEFAVRGLGTPAPIAPTRYLVTTALHRYVRNPMYIGVFLVLAGEALLLRSLHLVEYIAGFCVVVELFVVFYEEPALQRQFGESYEQYKKTVPRWIPKFKGS